MAVVPQDLYVIRDTFENKIMPGAKKQFAFDSKERARRSLVHTGWWEQFKRDEVVRVFMPNGDKIISDRNKIQNHITHTLETKKVWDENALEARGKIDKEIEKWKRQPTIGGFNYYKEFDKIKFDTQKRFAVESLVSVETKEI